MDLHKLPVDREDFSESLNDNNNFVNSLLLRNNISQLQDRAVTPSSDGGLFVEAYTSSSGRNSSVDDTLTTAFYDVDNDTYVSLKEETVEAWDGEAHNDSSATSKTVDCTLASDGFFSEFNGFLGNGLGGSLVVSVGAETLVSVSLPTDSGSFIITANYSDYSRIPTSGEVVTVTLTSTGDRLGYYTTNQSYTGTAFSFPSTSMWGSSGGEDNLVFTPFVIDETLVVHDIPSGSFSENIASSFLTAKVVDWEEGANIQFKITNSYEDTGYADYNTILSASRAFIEQPTKLYVKLIPKTTSPTIGVPSVSGVALMGDRE